ncbi:MAG: SDR family NAD(P)-dependent oxidoreductase [Planctomycetaceae bacterium]|nr:SDR family NAD(P)-dependent oxidoreductase [Planctomycetaceae bacterium]
MVPGDTFKAFGSDRYQCDLRSSESVARLRQEISGTDKSPVGMVIHVGGLSATCRAAGTGEPETVTGTALGLFLILKHFREDLLASAKQGGGFVYNLIALDGKFGLGDGPRCGIAASTTIGLCKSFARENPALSVTTFDIDPALKAERLVARVTSEFLSENLPTELGLSERGRFRLELKPDTSPLRGTPCAVKPGGVILVTGGGYGITAEVIKPLAQPGVRLVIVGRSRLSEESAATADLPETALRGHFLQAARAAGEKLVPAEIERKVAATMRQRELQRNLAEFREAGAEVSYFPCDVSDAESFGSLIDEVYERYGRIDGVVHGAGVILDKLIQDKSPESFLTVLSTKIDSALTLTRKLRPESLGWLVFFSSVSARFGNGGQTDYSAANEYLNKLAGELDRSWPARVVAINWGPWDSGMVSDGLRQLYQSRGISLIPVDGGVRRFHHEISLTDTAAHEVVVSCSVEAMSRLSAENV